MNGSDIKHIKIVYLVGGPLTKRWLSYYCVDEMAVDFDVEFWDIAALLPDGYDVSAIEERVYERTILSMDELRQNLKRLSKDTLLVNEIGLVPSHYEVLKMVASYIPNGIVIDFWTYNMWDIWNKSQAPTSQKGIKQYLYQFDAIWYISKLLHCRSMVDVRDLRKALQIRKENRHIMTEEENCKRLFKIYEMTYKPFQQYTINHPDYEKYLQVRYQKDRLDKYIVFIADDYPYHPETIIRPGYDREEVSKQYYASLNRFFDKVEKTYACKVVIAEHPSARWVHNPFDGREMVFFKTAELVRDSYAVCLHCSCAFSFAALFDKPVAILYNQALEANDPMRLETPLMAQAIRGRMVDIDTMEDITGIFQPIDKEARAFYIRTFADADSNIPNEQLMKQHFINIHNEILKTKS